MPTPLTVQLPPYAVPGDETNDDTETALAGEVEVQVVLKLVGTVSQAQADWATLLATNLTSGSVTASWA